MTPPTHHITPHLLSTLYIKWAGGEAIQLIEIAEQIAGRLN